MSKFDDGFGGSVKAELLEMGDPVIVEGVTVQGVTTDMVDNHTQSVGGRRDIHSFSIFLSKTDGAGAKKGDHVESGGRKGRVLVVEDLGGAGFELKCGARSSWSGEIPGI